MCAAPGSKTAQLIEMIQSDGTDGTIPQGLIIANDTDIKRCFILIHQTQRLQTPVVLVTNHDASQFPTITLEGTDPVSYHRHRSSGQNPDRGRLTTPSPVLCACTDYGQGAHAPVRPHPRRCAMQV